jgi:hypothetical protein
LAALCKHSSSPELLLRAGTNLRVAGKNYACGCGHFPFKMLPGNGIPAALRPHLVASMTMQDFCHHQAAGHITAVRASVPNHGAAYCPRYTGGPPRPLSSQRSLAAKAPKFTPRLALTVGEETSGPESLNRTSPGRERLRTTTRRTPVSLTSTFDPPPRIIRVNQFSKVQQTLTSSSAVLAITRASARPPTRMLV